MNVFLSHAWEDREAAELLAKQLAKAHVHVWDPERDLDPGENWSLKTGEALEKADAIVVLFSPTSAKSRLIRKEVEYALASPRFEGRLIIVEVKPTKNIPWILRKLQPIRLYASPARARQSILNRIRHLAKAPANAT
jgi:hypothetical protein